MPICKRAINDLEFAIVSGASTTAGRDELTCNCQKHSGRAVKWEIVHLLSQCGDPKSDQRALLSIQLMPCLAARLHQPSGPDMRKSEVSAKRSAQPTPPRDRPPKRDRAACPIATQLRALNVAYSPSVSTKAYPSTITSCPVESTVRAVGLLRVAG